jgi:hypothetical protein
VHTGAELFLKGQADTPMPPALADAPDVAFVLKELQRLRTKRAKAPKLMIVEDNWAFTKSWGPSRWDDWNGCYLRVKIDVAELTGNRLQITDWKTGKYRPDNRESYMEQQELYATAALNYFVHMKDLEVRSRLIYLDAQKVYPEPGEERIFTQADRLSLQKTWEDRTTPMFRDTQYAPKPNQFCGWCEFSKKNGGPCKF